MASVRPYTNHQYAHSADAIAGLAVNYGAIEAITQEIARMQESSR